MRRVVSVSLGASSRDWSVETEYLGEQFRIERIGTNGNLKKAAMLIEQLDGHIDCIGLGGMDRYLWVGKKRYTIRQVDRLAKRAVMTPVVDGSGLKNTLEPRIIEQLVSGGIVDFSNKRVLVLSGVDRYGMAESISKLGCEVVYGDLIFALGLPIPMKKLTQVNLAGTLLLPLICCLPMSFVYPTGEKQNKAPSTKKQSWLKAADIIAGDWHFLRKYLPADLAGKVIITNTTTPTDVQLLSQRGAKLLVTTTPRLKGRSFGQNMMESVVVTLSGKRPEELAEADYLDIIRKLDWGPSIDNLQQGGGAGAVDERK
jgi:hypothetical protein